MAPLQSCPLPRYICHYLSALVQNEVLPQGKYLFFNRCSGKFIRFKACILVKFRENPENFLLNFLSELCIRRLLHINTRTHARAYVRTGPPPPPIHNPAHIKFTQNINKPCMWVNEYRTTI